MRAGTITALPVAYLAVDLFYMLSSFVVAFAYEQQLQTGKMSLTAFARVRITRLYPLIFLGTSAGIVLGLFAALKGSITYQQVAFAETWGSFSFPLTFSHNGIPPTRSIWRPGPSRLSCS
jgi:peptidoglycan/LPS O-acetylase OafA/YrhL